MEYKLYEGDNILSLKKLEDNSIDSVVTDPPYGLSFMNKKWDYDVPSVEFWKEVYRVLKPGGHVLSFGGTRTYHRMTVNIEDAGFEIRDQIMWLYGSGFPKSHNIGKAVDKLQGNERDVVRTKKGQGDIRGVSWDLQFNREPIEVDITKGKSDWEGWGTALKPANEPICVARKPLSEKSVAENVLKWRTGGLNIDGCRVGTTPEDIKGMFRLKGTNIKGQSIVGAKGEYTPPPPNEEGRFPANIILECLCDEVIKGEKGEVKKYVNHNENTQYKDTKVNNSVNGVNNTNYNDKGDIHTNPDCPCYIMDNQSGVLSGQVGMKRVSGQKQLFNEVGTELNKQEFKTGKSDKGGASRFFYQAKVSKAERNLGLEVGFEEKETRVTNMTSLGTNTTIENRKNENGGFDAPKQKNNHPTVKPVNLMTYLCRLITPPNGIILDPFVGSGSTGIAALLEGFNFIGMDLDPDYIKIADSRIKNYEEYRKFLK
jgi:DNA modification methylase